MQAALIAFAALAAESAHDVAQVVEKKGGLPQLNADDFAPQLIWLAIIFVTLYLVMKRVALPRIAEVIEERRDRIDRDLDAAERLKAETEKALEAYERALADARASAAGLARETAAKLNAEVEKERARVDGELGTRLAAAESRIAAVKGKALAGVGEIAAETTAAIVEKLIGQGVSRDEVGRALESGSPE
ncbi:MAG TPA: F0F1 ATP synthase subunit B' [Hyphomicrobiaceae bacterium]|nr:F0F1 ATP synthase subunit B' [Hyphomicrobiaceae bacterium]